jgi:hypothetical protein
MGAFEFSDAVLGSVIVNVRDARGRRASVSFTDEGLVFHDRRPMQGKKAKLSYEELLDAVEYHNDKFFEPSKRRK